MESSLDFTPDFSKSGGLVAAVAQDAETGEVLMLAWMNPEAWEKTLETGEVHYYSRSRKSLWHKGRKLGQRPESPLHSAGLRFRRSTPADRAERGSRLP